MAVSWESRKQSTSARRESPQTSALLSPGTAARAGVDACRFGRPRRRIWAPGNASRVACCWRPPVASQVVPVEPRRCRSQMLHGGNRECDKGASQEPRRTPGSCQLELRGSPARFLPSHHGCSRPTGTRGRLVHAGLCFWLPWSPLSPAGDFLLRVLLSPGLCAGVTPLRLGGDGCEGWRARGALPQTPPCLFGLLPLS